MNILVTGSSGFVGTALVNALLAAGHRVTGISHQPGTIDHQAYEAITADTSAPGDWQQAVPRADAVINLAGINIFSRWNEKYKQLIYDSRILTTRHLVGALPEDAAGLVFCSTSAVGYYGDRGDDILDEASAPGTDFLARVCVDWEKEAFAAQKKGARVVATRFGVVLGPGGGALAKMLPAYLMGMGGPLGSGNQWFPWIQIDDLVSAMMFVLENEAIKGPANFCAPGAVRNRQFSASLARTVKRPAFFKVPGVVMKVAAGEMGGLILNSQRARPAVLLENGFSFQYPDIDAALTASVGKGE
ncbi:MAG: TIGR01777 family oxidoreductase [Thermodesulfobacteriota bacterium]|nr:TIGR01777 family oxidoreductase [Thermodesulfobacteriota bacterium]